jgi:hypothetical protein
MIFSHRDMIKLMISFLTSSASNSPLSKPTSLTILANSPTSSLFLPLFLSTTCPLFFSLNLFGKDHRHH